MSAVYALSLLFLALATLKATASDPADPHVHMTEAPEYEDLPWCSACNCHVNHKSKHCRSCHKCIDVFDHHCMWLNTCIGSANYRSFIATITSVAAMIAIVLGTCLYLIIDYGTNQGYELRLHSSPAYGRAPKELFLAFHVILLAVNVPLFALDMQLVLLHAFLVSQDLTTYEYIMGKRENEGGGEEQAKSPSMMQAAKKRIKTLPSCLDWIVFSRCGKRRRPKQDGVERIGGGSEVAPSASRARPPATEQERVVTPEGRTFPGTE